MGIDGLIDALGLLADLKVILIMILATVVGMVVGALPGLGTVTALALVLPVTFVLTGPQTIGLLLAIYVASVYGGSISAILINVPGTPQSAATTFDGYPMAQQGRAAEALGWATVASTVGGIFSLIVLVVAAPQLTALSVAFGSIETFALIVFSLTTIAWVSAANPLKGLLAGVLGVILSLVGVDQMAGVDRFTFGNFSLSAGFHVVPILIGLFALSEVLVTASQGIAKHANPIITTGFRVAGLAEWWALRKTLLRSSLLGTFLGVLPGVGATAASLIGYARAKSRAPNGDTFGTGVPEGIIASETANNAVTGGALIPTLALGIPGDAATAVMQGALIIHGITPGVHLFDRNPELVRFIFVALLVANGMMLIVAAVLAHVFTRVLKVPHALVMGCVVALSLAGSWVIRFSILDVWVAVCAGLVGLLLRTCNVPLAPVVIGFILGKPLETTLRQGLIVTQMHPLRFFRSPIAFGFFAATLIVILWPLFRRLLNRYKCFMSTRVS